MIKNFFLISLILLIISGMKIETNYDNTIITNYEDSSDKLINGLEEDIYKTDYISNTEQIINADFIGPERFSINDKPVFSLKIKNLLNKNLELDISMKTNNGIIVQNRNRIFLKAHQSDIIDFELNNYNKDYPVNLSYTINFQKNILIHEEKKIVIRTDSMKQSFDISGSIQGVRITKSNFSIPDKCFSDYSLTLFFSSNKYITYLKKISLLDNIKTDDIDFELKKYLDSYIELKLMKQKTELKFTDKYYMQEKGFKRNSHDKNINPESTILILFTAKYIPEIFSKFNSKLIIDNLIKNYRKKILQNSFSVFVLAEYGIFFKDIDYNFTKELRDESISVLYYRYFLKHKIKFNKKAAHSFNEYSFGKYKISSELYKMIALYFNVSDIDYDSINFYSNMLDIIIGKTLIINKLFKMNKSNKLIEFSFESNKLGTFNAMVHENDIVYKKYNYDIIEEIESDKKFINYSIDKKTEGQLYYLIIVEYKMISMPILENKNLEIHSEFIDEEGKVLDQNNLVFPMGKIYYINFYIKNNIKLKNVYIKPILCNGLNIDFDNIFFNNTQYTYLNDDCKLIFIDYMNEGLNILKYQIKTVYKGKYFITGCSIFDINNLYNFLEDSSLMINIK